MNERNSNPKPSITPEEREAIRKRKGRRDAILTILKYSAVLGGSLAASKYAMDRREEEYGATRKSIVWEYVFFKFVTIKGIEDHIKTLKTKKEVQDFLDKDYRSDDAYRAFLKKYLKDLGVSEDEWLHSLNPDLK